MVSLAQMWSRAPGLIQPIRDPLLHGVQHRQEKVPLGPRRAPAVRHVPVGRGALPAVPAGLGRPENRGDGGAFVIGRGRRDPEP